MENPFYFDLRDEKRESALGFLVESLLKSRIEVGAKKQGQDADEDVNMYLAFLLLEASTPAYPEKIRQLTSPRDTDIFKMVEDSQDNGFKCRVYKTNADYLLLLLSVFQDFLNKEGKAEAAFFEKSQSAYEGYARTYYQFASEYDRLIHRRQTGLGVVLQKLSRFFSVYEQILINTRKDYLHFLTTKEGAFSQFLKELDQYKEALQLREKQDLFLDTYSAYLKTPEARLKQRLHELGRELQRLDPSFKMPPLEPSRIRPKSS